MVSICNLFHIRFLLIICQNPQCNMSQESMKVFFSKVEHIKAYSKHTIFYFMGWLNVISISKYLTFFTEFNKKSDQWPISGFHIADGRVSKSFYPKIKWFRTMTIIFHVPLDYLKRFNIRSYDLISAIWAPVGRPKGVSLWPLNCPLITIHLASPWSWNLPKTAIIWKLLAP